jgi:hypothetical protein
MDVEPEYGWKEDESKLYEQLYRKENGSLMYGVDTYTENGLPQTEISDWHEPRYEARKQEWYQPGETDDEVLHSSMDWSEIETFLQLKTSPPE